MRKPIPIDYKWKADNKGTPTQCYRRVGDGDWEPAEYDRAEHMRSLKEQEKYERSQRSKEPKYRFSVHGTMSSFMAGRSNNQEYDSMPKDMRDHFLGKAKKAGVNTRNAVYMSGLAEYSGDPRAWVSSHDDVKRRVKEKNWTIQDK